MRLVWRFSEDPTITEFAPRSGAPGAPDQLEPVDDLLALHAEVGVEPLP